MLNPNEIDPKHLPSLQAAIMKNRSRLDEHLVSKLYKTAKAGFDATDLKGLVDSKTSINRSATAEGAVMVTCTDIETGLFVLLSKSTPESTDCLMTFGKKFCQEYRDSMRQNVATKIW